MAKWICLNCFYLEQEEIEAHFEENQYGVKRLVPSEIAYWCTKKFGHILTKRETCLDYLALQQTKMEIGEDDMVKVDEIPAEQPRLDLSQLPQEVELLAVAEKMQAEAVGKTGGLVLTYQLRDGRQFQQKYSKVSGAELITALKKLKYATTEPLFKTWHTYKLTNMRIGFPRMIPVAKAKTE